MCLDVKGSLLLAPLNGRFLCNIQSLNGCRGLLPLFNPPAVGWWESFEGLHCRLSPSI